jgi:hypothetical protein
VSNAGKSEAARNGEIAAAETTVPKRLINVLRLFKIRTFEPR